MTTAGRSVVFASITVVVSLVGVLTMNQPYIPGVVGSAVLTVLAVLLAAVTLLPALLPSPAPGSTALRRRTAERRDAADAGRGSGTGGARSVQRHPVAALVTGLVMIGVLVPGRRLRLGPDSSNDPTSLTTRRAFDPDGRGFGEGSNRHLRTRRRRR